MQRAAVLTVIASAMFAVTNARVYETCELAYLLKRFGVPKEQIGTWVCIAYYGAHFDTQAGEQENGDHGILQINEMMWCGKDKACGLPCGMLHDADLRDDVKCAMRVHAYHANLLGDGFLGWSVYNQHCRVNAKRFLFKC